MFRCMVFVWMAGAFAVGRSAAEDWRTVRLHDRFFTEGASAGDIDGDGLPDLVAGPLWFRGPDFQQKTTFATPREFPVEIYSDQFFSHVADVNGDGFGDVLVVGFPGTPASLYVNPGGERNETNWPVHSITGAVDNESPAFVDIVPGGAPELVCGHEGAYGYFAAGSDPTAPWQWNPVSLPGACAGRFAHGMGVGDVDGDGRLDVLDKTYWWQQPTGSDTKKPWPKNRWCDGNFPGGSQIRVDDLDGDGDSDIVSSLAAHGWGLAWFEQTTAGQFKRHDIMGDSSTQNDYGVAFSQLHALELRDMDGDGRRDIVTGKRWMAHRGKDVGGLQEPVLYWFANTKTDDGIDFQPRLIDNDSGVGTDVLVTDLNGDKRLDVVSSSKRGLSIHFQTDKLLRQTPQKWNAPEGKDQADYAEGLDPAAAAEAMQLPNGFMVDLIASEPAVTQPVAMCFDDRGRIWVVEGHTYPTKAAAGEGRDRVVIFSDEDADGAFETKKTFTEGLNLASGIEVGFGGVWIGAAPELMFIPDADRDDVPDGPPQVLLDGWGHHDTHETLNSFTWGPDGWLYGCQGIFTHSKVGKPGTPDGERVPMNAGVWRYHPTDHRFEVFAHGTSNPWGVDFNEVGDWFISACVIPHLYHVIQGGRYQRQAGRHFNPYTFDDLKTIADHLHYTGSIRDHAFWGENKTAKPAAPVATSLLGGGHAHCGLAIYNGGVFPSEYDDALLFHNLHGHRVVREHVEREGSGYVGRHRPDFALAKDHKQIGVGVMVGPDGAIYTSDWHDIQTCHNGSPEVWDRTDGRIFRIRYGDVQPQQFDLSTETDMQLIDRLGSDNDYFARQARRVLQERAAAGAIVDSVLTELRIRLGATSSTRDRLRILWTLHAVGGLDHKVLVRLIRDDNPYVRGWAVHFAGESHVAEPLEENASTNVGLAYPFGEQIAPEPNPIVRRYYASILQRLPIDQRLPIIRMLTKFEIDAADRNLPLLVWYGIEPAVETEPDEVLEIARQCKWPNLFANVIRRLSATENGRRSLVMMLANPKHEKQQPMLLKSLDASLAERPGAAMPKEWPTAFALLSKSPDVSVQQLARRIAVQLGDANVLPYFRKRLGDRSLPTPQRRSALSAIRSIGAEGMVPDLLGLLDDPAIASDAVSFLATKNDAAIPDALLKHFHSLNESARTAALTALASRPNWASQMIGAMEEGRIDAAKVPAFVVRQVTSIRDPNLNERLEKVWGRIRQSDQQKQTLYTKYRALLTPTAIADANARRGRQLYETNCGKCHRLFGSGGDIGPDITGANRTSVDYWLENILEPNALIGKAYQVTTVLTDDGRVIVGIVVDENDEALTLQTASEKIVLRRDRIDEAKASQVSLMPEGQLQPMNDDQVKDLMKYLTSTNQVRLPPARRTGTIVEAESLKGTVSSGTARSQGMAGFGDDWSGDQQLWWTGAKVGATMELTIPKPANSKASRIAIDVTTARDYATIRIETAQGDSADVDLYSSDVTMAAPVVLKAGDAKEIKLTVTVTGANPAAAKSYMVGIDCVRLID